MEKKRERRVGESKEASKRLFLLFHTPVNCQSSIAVGRKLTDQFSKNQGCFGKSWEDALASNDIQTINRHLYRVWKLSASDYNFKYHTSTTATIEDGDKEIKQYYRLTSISSLLAMHPRKVTVSVLGKLITKSGDKENTMLQ